MGSGVSHKRTFLHPKELYIPCVHQVTSDLAVDVRDVFDGAL